MRQSKARTERGSILVFISILMFAIIVIGIGFFFLIKTFAGMRELQNVTESGNLNVAKTALRKPNIKLSPGLEQDNFGGLVDRDGTVNLFTYNRLVGQVLLVALNAQAQGTPESRDHARTLISTLQASTESIGQRLTEALSDGFALQGSFDKLAGANFLRLLGQAVPNHRVAEFQPAYLKKGESANVYLDPSILPANTSVPTNTYSSGRADSTGFQYLSGYQPFTVPGIGSISGVPVFPNQRPHLVSTTDFRNGVAAPVSGVELPPNSFQSAGTAKENSSRDFLRAISCSIVGALNGKFTASIPRGYLVINNPAGSMDQTSLPNPNTMLNNELFTGVYVANNGAFSTDMSLIQQWAEYNSHNPPVGPQPSTEGLFGDPRGITSLGGNGYPAQCDYTSLDGAGATPGCQSLENAFRQAYGANDTLPGTRTELTAVEQLRANVLGLFPKGGDITVPSGFTGIRVFPYETALPLPAGQAPQFSTNGTLTQILAQVGNGSGAEQTLLAQLRQRMREIKPEATESEINAVLSSRTIGLGQRLYIYLNDSKLQLTDVPPSWLVPNTVPDGAEQIIASSFQTIGTAVNPPGDSGFRNIVFSEMPNPASFGRGREEAIFTPSSGFNNLLGTLEFRSRIEPAAQNNNSAPGTDDRRGAGGGN